MPWISRKLETKRVFKWIGVSYSEGIIIVLVGEVNKFAEAKVREKLKRLSQLIEASDEEYFLKLRDKSYSKVKEQIKRDKNNEEEDDWGIW